MSDVASDEEGGEGSAPTHKHLHFGQTPWDDMPREQLLRETQRLFAACVSTRSALAMIRCGQEGHPFWSRQGTAGRALTMGEHALKPYGDGDAQSENIYRAFFRSAVDLLFPGLGVGFGWQVCECGTMTGAQPDGSHSMRCPDCAFKGRTPAPMRPLQWSDLDPAKAEG